MIPCAVDMSSGRDVFVLHLGALGDVLLDLPYLRALRAEARRAGGRLVVGASRPVGDLLVAARVAAHAIDATRPEAAGHFHPRAAATVGPSVAERIRSCRGGAVLFLDRAEEVEASIRALGVDRVETAASVRPRLRARAGRRPYALLHVPRAEREGARLVVEALGLRAGARFLALHPGSGALRKCWPVERFRELGLAARRALGLAPVALVGPVELESRPELRDLFRASGVPVVEALSLPRLAGLLRAAAAYVGNDSGPSHLAAAVGTQTVAIFGPTDPARFGPRGLRVRVVARPPAQGGLEAIPVADVLAALAPIVKVPCVPSQESIEDR